MVDRNQLHNCHRMRIGNIYNHIINNGTRKFMGFANSSGVPADYYSTLPPTTEVFYTDGSWCTSGLRNGLSSAAIAYQDTTVANIWITEANELGRNFGDNNDAELHAIFMALRTALSHIIVGRRPTKTIVILSDSQPAVSMFEQPNLNHRMLGPIPKDGRWALEEIYDIVEVLYGVEVVVNFQWIPGHAGIEGTERADTAALDANQRQSDKQGPTTLVLFNNLFQTGCWGTGESSLRSISIG